MAHICFLAAKQQTLYYQQVCFQQMVITQWYINQVCFLLLLKAPHKIHALWSVTISLVISALSQSPLQYLLCEVSPSPFWYLPSCIFLQFHCAHPCCVMLKDVPSCVNLSVSSSLCRASAVEPPSSWRAGSHHAVSAQHLWPADGCGPVWPAFFYCPSFWPPFFIQLSVFVACTCVLKQ